MAILKQSTAYTRMFKMISSTDHISAKASASPTVNLSKAGGSFGAAGGTVTEVANGWYKVALTTTDTNTLGDLAFYITGSGADDTDFVDQITTAILGDTLSANILQVNSDSTAAVNLQKSTDAICRGTCTTGGSTTSIPTSAFSPGVGASGQFIGRTVIFDSNTTTTALQGQATAITNSSNSATPTLTVIAMTTAPSSGDTFSIV